MTKKTIIGTLAIAALCSTLMPSCSSDDPSGGGSTNNGEAFDTGKGAWFVAVKAESGTEYIMQAQNVESGELDIKQNVMELPQQDYTWIFKGPLAVGMVYQQQFAGIGYGLKLKSDSTLEKLGEFKIDDRFSNYGFFGNQLVTSVAGQLSSDQTRNDGATFCFFDIKDDGIGLNHSKTLWTEDVTGKEGLQITFSSILDMGDDTFLSSMVKSTFHQTGTGNGSSIGDVTSPDSVWVARMDKDLNITHVYKSNNLSYSAGRYRSQVLPQLLKTDDGTVYVFSNGFVRFEDKNVQITPTTNAHHAGALRIDKGADDFAEGYMFDIEKASGGYPFRRVWYMTDHKFVLEIYNATAASNTISVMSPGHQFAIVDMKAQTFTWVKGDIPAKNMITSGAETGGVPTYYNGKLYLPITEFTKDAAIYVVDPQTGVATKGATFKGVKEIRTIGHLTAQ